jgi:TRAP-type C4-dicarboxylate transport system permease small subunit
MRTYLTVSLLVLFFHLAAVLLLGVYRNFLTTIGGLLIHATDIADLPDQLFAGVLIVGGLLLLIAMVLVYTRRRTSRRLTSA